MKVNAATKKKLVEIGKMIRAARRRAGISQAVLAEAIGMARENYIRIEKGRVNLTVETLMRVADGLRVALGVRFIGKSEAPGKRSRI